MSIRPGQTEQNFCTSQAHSIFRAHTFCLVKRKNITLQIFSRIRKTMKNVQWIPDVIVSTSVLVIFTYLMARKLVYLLMDWEIFNQLPALEQVRGVIRALKTSIMERFAKLVNTAYLRTWTILAKSSILDGQR